MAKWKLQYYGGKEIKTVEDLAWVACEIERKFKTGRLEMQDIMALTYLKEECAQWEIDGKIPKREKIESRAEILDI